MPLQLFGPAVSGTPHSILPGVDFAWFPVESTGPVSIPMGVLFGWVASRATAAKEAGRDAYADLKGQEPTGEESSVNAR